MCKLYLILFFIFIFKPVHATFITNTYQQLAQFTAVPNGAQGQISTPGIQLFTYDNPNGVWKPNLMGAPYSPTPTTPTLTPTQTPTITPTQTPTATITPTATPTTTPNFIDSSSGNFSSNGSGTYCTNSNGNGSAILSPGTWQLFGNAQFLNASGEDPEYKGFFCGWFSQPGTGTGTAPNPLTTKSGVALPIPLSFATPITEFRYTVMLNPIIVAISSPVTVWLVVYPTFSGDASKTSIFTEIQARYISSATQ